MIGVLFDIYTWLRLGPNGTARLGAKVIGYEVERVTQEVAMAAAIQQRDEMRKDKDATTVVAHRLVETLLFYGNEANWRIDPQQFILTGPQGMTPASLDAGHLARAALGGVRR